MTYDRIIIHGNVTAPFQHIYVYKNGERVDSIGVHFEDIAETALNYLEKYQLDCIELSGTTLYMQGIEKDIKEKAITKYAGLDFIIKYV